MANQHPLFLVTPPDIYNDTIVIFDFAILSLVDSREPKTAYSFSDRMSQLDASLSYTPRKN